MNLKQVIKVRIILLLFLPVISSCFKNSEILKKVQNGISMNVSEIFYYNFSIEKINEVPQVHFILDIHNSGDQDTILLPDNVISILCSPSSIVLETDEVYELSKDSSVHINRNIVDSMLVFEKNETKKLRFKETCCFYGQTFAQMRNWVERNINSTVSIKTNLNVDVTYKVLAFVETYFFNYLEIQISDSLFNVVGIPIPHDLK